MSLESRKGYYGDLQGNWQKDRRRGSDRRKEQNVPLKDRRKMMARRKADQLLVEQEHKKMIREALDDHAAENEQS